MWNLFVIFLTISSPVFAAKSDALIGTWKLVSWQVIVENEAPQNVFGSNPKGYLILTPEGRGVVVTTDDDRRRPKERNGRCRPGGAAQVDARVQR